MNILAFMRFRALLDVHNVLLLGTGSKAKRLSSLRRSVMSIIGVFPNPLQITRFNSAFGLQGRLIGTTVTLQSTFRPFFFLNLRMYFPLYRLANANILILLPPKITSRFFLARMMKRSPCLIKCS